jgi:uncharacterized protein YoxC
MSKGKQSGGVTIGKIGGALIGSTIVGKNLTINVGGQPTPAEKEPSFDELQKLLLEIQQEISEITTQKEALKAVSAAAPHDARGAEARINNVASHIEKDMQPENANSVENSLKEATGLLKGILEGAKDVAKKTDEVANAVKPLAEKLEPLVVKAGVAALWVAKLWLTK